MISALLLLGSWLVPIHFLPWVSWHSEVLAFAAVWGLVLALHMAQLWRGDGGARQIVLPPSVLLWPALGLIVLLQWLAGKINFAGDALVLGLYFALCAAAWGTGHAAERMVKAAEAKTHPALEILAWTLLLGASLSALIAMVQALDVWGAASWVSRMPQLRRPGANLGQPNQLATLLTMGLASLLLLHQRQRLGHYAAGLLCLVIVSALAVTESRTGILSMAMLTLWVLWGQHSRHLEVKPRYVISAFLFFVLMYVAWHGYWQWSQATGAVVQRVQINTSPGMRLVVWPQLLEAVAMQPWTGWGLREVATAQNAVVSSHTLSEPYIYAHNVILDLLLGFGVPLTLLLLGLTWVWVRRRLRANGTLWSWYCLAAVLPVAVHSMLEFPFAYAYFLAPVMFILGYWESMTGGQSTIRIDLKMSVLLVLLVVGIAAWTVSEYVEIEEDFRVVRFESMRVGKTPVDHQQPQILLLTQLDGLLRAGRIVPKPGMSPEAIELARKAALRFPWPATQNRYALTLALNGQVDEALRQLQVIRAQHGEKAYADVRTNWQSLAVEKHEALRHLALP